MRKQLADLRKRMKAEGLDVYIVPSSDWHGSEYVHDRFKCREYVSGFTGSAGTLIVEQERAGLWTDGRYFIQAQRQLAGSGIGLMRMGEEGVPTVEEYLASLGDGSRSGEASAKKMVVGFDGRVITEELGRRLEEMFSVRHDVDLVDEIWEERPQIIPSQIREIPMEVTGESTESKLKRLRSAMGDAGHILLSSLEEIAWLYNLRGADIAHTPVFYSFALISKTRDILYVMDESRLTGMHWEDHTTVYRSYGRIYEDLAGLKNCTVMLDRRTASYAIKKSFDASVKIIMDKSPVELFKAIKNETETAATKNAHIRDGAAVTEFIYWLKHALSGENRGAGSDGADIDIGTAGRPVTELSAAAYLADCRKKHGAYELSFETIAGYEEHGAIVHYAATEDTDVELKPEGFLLVDSGGQYHDGTTDITRTIALGAVSDDRRKHYTAVLKGHIALALARFDEETTGAELDAMARKPLQDLGLDYGHGTGHGVGHMLSVHEGPNTISKRGTDSHILPGMITSNEPGVYLEGEYGIRIENELLCIKMERNAFEPITFCPFERDAIEKSMLTETETAYIDNYHEKVYHTLKELMPAQIKRWLKDACKPL